MSAKLDAGQQAAGRSTDDVLEAFPMLTASDVDVVHRETVACLGADWADQSESR